MGKVIFVHEFMLLSADLLVVVLGTMLRPAQMAQGLTGLVLLHTRMANENPITDSSEGFGQNSDIFV